MGVYSDKGFHVSTVCLHVKFTVYCTSLRAHTFEKDEQIETIWCVSKCPNKTICQMTILRYFTFGVVL